MAREVQQLRGEHFEIHTFGYADLYDGEMVTIWVPRNRSTLLADTFHLGVCIASLPVLRSYFTADKRFMG